MYSDAVAQSHVGYTQPTSIIIHLLDLLIASYNTNTYFSSWTRHMDTRSLCYISYPIGVRAISRYVTIRTLEPGLHLYRRHTVSHTRRDTVFDHCWVLNQMGSSMHVPVSTKEKATTFVGYHLQLILLEVLVWHTSDSLG